MTIVVDSSVVVAALIDSGPVGQWAEEQLSSAPLAAPQLMPVEAANILQRSTLTAEISADVASLAHEELGTMPIDLFPYSLVASRVWEMRANVTAYDAWYVALAEMLGARLATLDLRLSRAQGPRCEFAVPLL
jgi:predicted nucleic acid-binding protein